MLTLVGWILLTVTWSIVCLWAATYLYYYVMRSETVGPILALVIISLGEVVTLILWSTMTVAIIFRAVV